MKVEIKSNRVDIEGMADTADLRKLLFEVNANAVMLAEAVERLQLAWDALPGPIRKQLGFELVWTVGDGKEEKLS